MLDPVPMTRHLMVGAAMLASPVLVLVGVLGGGVHEERFDAKQVLVVPAGDGVRIREVVDQDFGTQSKHGYERIIPNDFGVPTDVIASSPDAPDQVSVVDMGIETRIRIGDPDTTVTGQHRYELTYTLPAAQLSSGQLALDIIGDQETLETGRFEVVLAGFEFSATTCNVGSFGTVGGCSLERDGDVYRTVIAPLEPHQIITVGGTITALTEPAPVPVPDIPARRPDSPRVPLALGIGSLGVLAGVGTYMLARRMGRNEVGGATAADAAYAGSNEGPVRLVTDRELQAMATTEFEPPRGIRPWQGALLLDERIDHVTVGAWFSDQIAQQVVELRDDGTRTLVAGPKLDEAPPITKQRFETLLGSTGQLQLGTYDPKLGHLWSEIEQEQRTQSAESGWWKKFPPGSEPRFPAVLTVTVVALTVALAIAIWRGWLHAVPVAIGAGLAVPAIVAASAYRPLLPVRSAAGSAMALRAESFRRFLEASEGKHVDWAWQHGLLREYSAWAVALGAAEAWGRAVASSAVPPQEVSMNTMPLFLALHASDWQSTAFKPSSSGSGGSSGFSGGFAGGGGGGGSSGSW